MLDSKQIVVAKVLIRGSKKRVWKSREKKIKAWKRKDSIKRRIFRKRVSDRLERANADHAGLSNASLNSAREVCGETTGRR